MTIPGPWTLSELTLTSEAPTVVLDTNVVLDWLLFAEPAVADWAAAIVARRLRWAATTSMRDELEHVLRRGLATDRGQAPDPILQAWDTHATLQPAPPGQSLRVSDPDDQKFVDLAVACGARWLVSRDQALLKLARRAAAGGLAIVAPRAFCSNTRHA